MAKIQINNPRQIINGGAKKYYFKVKGLGGPKGDKGDKGDTGSRGPQGEPGNAATVSVGSTTTLPVGYDATVENVGSIYNAVLDFGIPQGPRGPQGAKGDKGDTGAKGDTGPRGPQGERGTNATVSIGTTSTLNPGSQATVYNSGTDSNAVLNFGIPKGEKGDTGPMPTIAQTTGQAIDQVMSQKATTDALNTKQATITNSNKLSADLVTDTTTTNKFVTAEDKTTWNAKQNALTAGAGIDITSDVISTPALVPEVVASLPAEGTEGKLYLTPKNYTTGTATGNPITISLGEDAGQITSFQLDGDTYQQSYEGKNLWGGFLSDFSRTSQGVSYTNKADGTILANGTSSGNALSLLSSDATSNGRIITLQAGDYVLSGGTSTVLLQVVSSSGEEIAETASDGVKAFTLSVATDIFVRARMTRDTVADNVAIKPMLEAGSTASDYEPYVGGVPSPNPDYPQPIQTVTGEQTVEIVGKNLFDKNTMTLSNVAISPNIGSANGYTTVYIPCEPNTTYTAQKAQETTRFFVATTEVLPAPGVQGTPISSSASGTVKTFTTGASARYIAVMVRSSSDTLTEAQVVAGVQIELGSTASSYAPYSKQTLPISLGSIELCKLDTYQDYIYKDGDDWKVHKAIGSMTADGNTQIEPGGFGTYSYQFVVSEMRYSGIGNIPAVVAAPFYPISYNDRTLELPYSVFAANKSANVPVIYIRNTNWTSSNALSSWFASNPTKFRYILYAPTDTTITDQTLITQLEAIRTASLQNGANTITNSATGSNLAGDMEISYYGYNPTNRYDKFIWLDLNNNYEQIGS